jgi:TldD protein
MKQTRRNFLRTTALGAAAAGMSRNIITDWRTPLSLQYPDDEEALLRQLANTALQAARDGGASYADIRFTRDRAIMVQAGTTDVEPPAEVNLIQAGVRVIVENTWGFASMSTRSTDEVAKLARTAVRQAKTSSWSGRSSIELAPTPRVEGRWEMPITRDPIGVPIEEMLEDINAAHSVATKHSDVINVHSRIDFARQDQVFASTDGSFTVQRIWKSIPFFPSHGSVAIKGKDGSATDLFAPFFWLRGAGYEAFKNANYPQVMEQMIEKLRRMKAAPPVEPGAYEVVLDGDAMCYILSATWADHTQIDRALGYEANASGTSWVAPPEELLGKKKIGHDLLTVKCNRNTPLSPCNVKWDAEGVEPEEFTVIDKGVLVDYQTTREQVAWLQEYYQRTGKPMRSHGCAQSLSAGHLTLQAAPNVIMQPSAADTKVDDLVSGISKGIYFEGGIAWTDQQGVTGQHGLLGYAYEIRNGKIGRMVKDAGLLFKTQEMYKKIQGLGGPSTVVFRGGGTYKGEPYQIGLPSGNSAPAVRLKDQKVTNTGSRTE